MLADPHYAGWTISAIALEAGFGEDGLDAVHEAGDVPADQVEPLSRGIDGFLLASSLDMVDKPAATREFIARAKRVVDAGRPPCPFCGQPLDPSGHLCPRHNGYRR